MQELDRRQLPEIIEIQELKEANWVVNANRMLKEGWLLLGVQGGRDESGEPYFLYSFGRRKPSSDSPE